MQPYKPLYRFVLLWLILFVGIISVKAEQKPPFDVLFVHSLTKDDTFVQSELEGLKDGFAASGVDVNLSVEYLNSRYWNTASEEEVMRRILKRARQRGTDIILTTKDEALYTLLTCGDSLPYLRPVVFKSVKFLNQKVMQKVPLITGFSIPVNFTQLLQKAIEIFPNRKKVILLTSKFKVSLFASKRFMEEWEDFSILHPEYELEELDVNKRELGEVLHKVQYADAAQSIVVAPYWDSTIALVSKVSKAPVFSLENSSMTRGCFGVLAPSPYKTAKEQALRASRILKGAPIKMFRVTQTPLVFKVDYKQLKFFHVDQSLLPVDTVIINKSPLERYLWGAIALSVLILAFLCLLIYRLLKQNVKMQQERISSQVRLLSQEGLVAQRNEFNRVFNAIRDGIVSFDNAFQIHFINRSALEQMKMSKDEFDLQGLAQINLHELFSILCDNHLILDSLIHSMHEEGDVCTLPEGSFLQMKKSGDFFPVAGEIVAVMLDDKVLGYTLSFRNVLDESRTKLFFDLAIKANDIYPYTFQGLTHTFIFSDKLPSFILNADNRTTIYMDEIRQGIHPDDLILFDKDFRLKMPNEANYQNIRFEIRHLTHDGEYEWFEHRLVVTKVSPTFGAYVVLGVCQSVQNYKNVQKELEAARDKAEQADKLKSAFLANMSHEIRTPLNAIVGFSGLLSDPSAFDKSELDDFIALINKNCHLLLVLIGDILDLSRIESGVLEFDVRQYHLTSLMEEVRDSQQLNMPVGVQLKMDIPQNEDDIIFTDEVRFKQVINNLINNAVKFTEKGSITIGYHWKDSHSGFVIYVKDTGAGMTSESVAHIFERFYKGSDFKQGAGLGLSICETIVKRFGGSIRVDSKIGEGTIFTVDLPTAATC